MSEGKKKANMATEMLEKIHSDENPEEEMRKVIRNKGAAGVDKMNCF